LREGGTHARRGIRSGSKLIESLDMAQTLQPSDQERPEPAIYA
jgi:hypothetical protein